MPSKAFTFPLAHFAPFSPLRAHCHNSRQPSSKTRAPPPRASVSLLTWGYFLSFLCVVLLRRTLCGVRLRRQQHVSLQPERAIFFRPLLRGFTPAWLASVSFYCPEHFCSFSSMLFCTDLAWILSFLIILYIFVHSLLSGFAPTWLGFCIFYYREHFFSFFSLWLYTDLARILFFLFVIFFSPAALLCAVRCVRGRKHRSCDGFPLLERAQYLLFLFLFSTGTLPLIAGRE